MITAHTGRGKYTVAMVDDGSTRLRWSTMKGVKADEEDERNEREKEDGTLRQWRLKKGKKKR